MFSFDRSYKSALRRWRKDKSFPIQECRRALLKQKEEPNVWRAVVFDHFSRIRALRKKDKGISRVLLAEVKRFVGYSVKLP